MKRKIDLESLPLKDWKKEATMFQDDYTAGAGTSWLLNVAKAENKMIWEMIRAIEEAPTLTPPNEPLTLEQLREMDAPVWCVCKSIGGENGGKNGYWCLCRYGYITSPGGTFLEIGEIPHWPFYRRPPEGEKGTE